MKNSCLSVDTKLIVVFFRFIQYLIDDEFQNAVYPGILFRRNGFALKVIKSYLHIVGSRYLEALLEPTISDVCITDQQISYEIDSSKVGNTENVQKNMEMLISKVENLLSRINSPVMIDKMPLGIRIIAYYIYQLGQRYFPHGNIWTAIGTILILRYVNPALVFPEKYNFKLAVVSPTARRNLILIAKVLQNISNGAIQEEGYMEILNRFVEQKVPLLQDYFINIFPSATCSSANLGDLDLGIVSIKDLYLFRTLLLRHKASILQLVAHKEEITELLNALGQPKSKE